MLVCLTIKIETGVMLVCLTMKIETAYMLNYENRNWKYT